VNFSSQCLFSEDILHREQIILQYEDLHLTESQLQNYALCDIERLLNKNERSLREFETMPYQDMLLFREGNNRLPQEESDYNRIFLAEKQIKLISGLNCEQINIYDAIIRSVAENKCGFFFVYGHGRTGKTYP
jgi:hypothetical protein